MNPMDELLRGIGIRIDWFWYNILWTLAGIGWSLARALVMMGYTIELLDQWLTQNAFTPLIQQTNASLQVAVNLSFFVALLVLGITYLLAVFVRLDVVAPKSAIMWYLAGALFFTSGPALYQSMTDFRRGVAQAFYLSALNGLQATQGGIFASLNGVQTTDLGLLPLCDNLGTYLPGATGPQGLDGLDVALSYLRADGIDVMGYPSTAYDLACQIHIPNGAGGQYVAESLPWEWRRPGSFFDALQSPPFYPVLTDDERRASLDRAGSSLGRLLTAYPLLFFGVGEQLVYLLLTIAQGLSFLSFGCAILFAFFKRTEVIARSILDLWIELIVQTIIIALVQSLVVSFFLIGTTAGSGLVVLGVGLICLVFMLIVLWSGVKAVWNSFNRLFLAFGQAAGGTFITPGKATLLTAGAGAAAAGGVAAVGTNALAGMNALMGGATPAQAAGLSLGGIDRLTSAARTLAYLPGVRNTALGEAAEQFSEGAITRRVAGPIWGMALLTDRDPAAAHIDAEGRVVSRPMLVPAVGEALRNWTVPLGSPPQLDRAPVEEQWVEDEDGHFYPLHPRRMGRFTPVATASDDSQSEELERAIDDSLQSRSQPATIATEHLKGAAETLQTQLITGELKVSGSSEIAGVLGDLIRHTRSEREAKGETVTAGMDHLAVAAQLAAVLGVQPLAGQVPIPENLSRFGLFVDQALRLGLSGGQAETVVQQVKASPEGSLQPQTRTALVTQVHELGATSWEEARRSVETLENRARLLPEQIVAVGQVRVRTNTAADTEGER